jgi:hypothetical protein
MKRPGRGPKQCVAASTPPPPAIGLYSRLPLWGDQPQLTLQGLHSFTWPPAGERQPKIFRAPCQDAPVSGGGNGTVSSKTAAASMERGSAAMLRDGCSSLDLLGESSPHSLPRNRSAASWPKSASLEPYAECSTRRKNTPTIAGSKCLPACSLM